MSRLRNCSQCLRSLDTGSWSATMAMARGASRCLMMSPNNSCAGTMPRAEAAAQLAHLASPPSCRPAACRRRPPACRAASKIRAASTPSCTGARPRCSTGLPRATSSRTSSGFVIFTRRASSAGVRRRRVHHFDQHVGEAAVVVADHALARGVVPFGKRGLEIRLDDVAAIREYAPGAARPGTARADTRGRAGHARTREPTGTVRSNASSRASRTGFGLFGTV